MQSFRHGDGSGSNLQPAVSDFYGVDSSSQVPDGDALGRFRNLLLKNNMQEKLFTQVVDLLNIMGAYNALMDMENVRIVKDMRNNVNRKVNCETANINKTVSAAVKQIEDIRFIQMSSAFDELPESLQEMAELRVRYPEATLAELGQLLDTPVGKSGVNHRLKKISLFADELRERHQQ